VKHKFNQFYVLRNDNPDDNGGGAGDNDQQQAAPDSGEDRIAAAIEQSFAKLEQRIPAPVAEVPRQLSPEEIKKALKVYEPSEELSQEFRAALGAEHGTGAMRKVLGKIFSGLSDQSATFTQLNYQKLKQDIDAEYAPVREHLTRQQKEAKKTMFFSEFPDLKDFEEVIPAVAQRLTNDDTKGKSEKEVRKLLADRTYDMIRKINPTFQPSQANGGTNPRPATVSSGGAGGAGGSSAKPRSSSIWS
jgi:hypothetical protein